MKNLIFALILFTHVIFGLEIKIIDPSQARQAKELVTISAYEIFRPSTSLQEFRQEMIDTDQFYDIDHLEQVYLDNNGIFLVLSDGNNVVATGGIRRLDETTAELKRMWMRKEYRGKGWGMKIATQLIAFAKEHGYTTIRLDVWCPEYQEAAIKLYKKLGFYEIAPYNQSPAKLFMELTISRN